MTMKYMAAYSLLVLGGNEAPNAEEVANFMRECGVQADVAEIEIMINAFAGRKIHDMINEGNDKVVEMFAEPEKIVEDVIEEVTEDDGSDEEVNIGNIFGDDEEYGDEVEQKAAAVADNDDDEVMNLNDMFEEDDEY